MLNLPNLLTLFRILLVPILVVVLLTKFDGREWWGLGLFLLAALTDVLDGYIARRRQQVTRFGKLLDPAADKILMSAAYISLVEMNNQLVPAWMVVAIIAREFAVSALRSFAASEGVVLAAGFSGKLKTVLQVISVSLVIVHERLGEMHPVLHQLAPIALWLALLATLFSGIDYFVRFGRMLRRGPTPGGAAE